MNKTYIDTAPQEVLDRAFGPHTDADLFPDNRLQQLREEFVVKSAEYISNLRLRFNCWDANLAKGYLPPQQIDNLKLRSPFRDTHFATPESIVDEWENADEEDGLCASRFFYRHEQGVREAYQAAKVYLIAKNEGLNAALVWKLTYGGAQ